MGMVLLCALTSHKKDEQDLSEFCKALYPDYQYEQTSIFVGAMVDYELAIKSLKTKAKKVLMAADESQLDEHGVAKAYSSWKLLPTEEQGTCACQTPSNQILE